MNLTEIKNIKNEWVECNFEEFPYFVTSTKNLNAISEISFTRMSQDTKGKTIQQLWTVRSEAGDHLPGPFEADVKRALDQICNQIGLDTVATQGYINFSLFRVAEILNLKGDGGWIWNRIRQALERMKTTNIHSKQSFYLKGKNTHITDTFSFIDRVQTIQKSDEEYQSGQGTYRVWFSKYYIESLSEHYTKPFNFSLYWSLNDPIPKRLYSIFDKRGYNSPKLVFNLMDLGKMIPLTPRPPSKIQQSILPGLNILSDKGFLTDFTFSDDKATGKKMLLVNLNKKQNKIQINDIPNDVPVESITENIEASLKEDILNTLKITKMSPETERFFSLVGSNIPHQIIYRAMAEVREELTYSYVKSKEGFFVAKIKRFAKESDIVLLD